MCLTSLRLALATAVALLAAAPAVRTMEEPRTPGQFLSGMAGAMIVNGLTRQDELGRSGVEPYLPHDSYSAAAPLSNEGYSPEDGITCYPKQGLCFKSDGKLDNKWTGRIYAN